MGESPGSGVEVEDGVERSELIEAHFCSFAGPEHEIQVNGRTVRFELSPLFGPIVLDAAGEIAERQPGSRSPFWAAFQEWSAPGSIVCRVEGPATEGTCGYATMRRDGTMFGRCALWNDHPGRHMIWMEPDGTPVDRGGEVRAAAAKLARKAAEK